MPFEPESPLPAISDAVRTFLDGIGSRTDFPAFAANVQSITGVSRDMEAQVGRLYDAIVQDVSLTAKVLQISNAVALSAGGGTITSVRQAILLLGFDRVRHLALAASVFEQLHRKTASVRELMALSLFSANHGYQIAMQAGFAKPEIAFLAGMFRNIGEVLVACYRPREYARWLALPPRTGRGQAAGSERRIIGVSFDDIGAALSQQWRMPHEITVTILGGTRVAGKVRDLHRITGLATGLTNAIYRDQAEQQASQLERLLVHYARPLGLHEQDVRDSVELALADSQETLRAVHTSMEALRQTAQIALAQEALAELERRPGSGEAATSGDADEGETPDESAHDWLDRDAIEDTGPEEDMGEARLCEIRTRDALQAMHDAMRATPGGQEVEVARVSRAALDAICGAGYRRAVLALSSEDFSRVRARMGSGDGHERVLREFLVRLTTGTSSLATALHARTDLFTDADAWPDLRRDPVLRSLAPHSFGLLPLAHDGRLLGCLYFDDVDAPVEASAELRGLLCQVRDQLVSAFARQQQREAA